MKSPKLASDEPALRISKLERETLHDRAYLEVKKAIMSGAIRPGATITIRAMAAALGTSPMPVREALSRRVAERALVMLPTRSVTVPLMTAEQFDAARIIREFLATASSTG
jgi:DNA-binding GntR family transcriptional regulator